MNRRRFLSTLAAAGVISALPASLQGCGGAASKASASESRSKSNRAVPTEADKVALPAFVASRNAFAWALYRDVVESDEEANAFLSPYSVSMAMTMAYAGAAGDTATQLRKALKLEGVDASVHAGTNALDIAVQASATPVRDIRPLALSVANSGWFDQKTSFVDAYLDLLASYYDAGAWRVDFRGNPGGSREAINTWVEEKTNDRIKDLIPEGVITSATRLVIANAIYFKADWSLPFDEKDTSPESFTLRTGIQRDVPFMHQTESHRYAQIGDVDVLELRYAGDQASMVILMPPIGEMSLLRRDIERVVDQALSGMRPTRMRLAMPRWEFSADYGLVSSFKRMGVVAAFDDGKADFSKITTEERLVISDIIHKAFVKVDEKGTEAAAATAVVMRATSAPSGEPLEMKINRPFVFFIRHVPTGAILFSGRVVEPAE